MYQVTRRNKIVEELQLLHHNGDLALSVTVDLNTDEIAGKVNVVNEKIQLARIALNKEQPDENAGAEAWDAMMELFHLIFGEENTEKLLTFYEGREAEMVVDILPFIVHEIMPRITEAVEARKAQILAMFKGGGNA